MVHITTCSIETTWGLCSGYRFSLFQFVAKLIQSGKFVQRCLSFNREGLHRIGCNSKANMILKFSIPFKCQRCHKGFQKQIWTWKHKSTTHPVMNHLIVAIAVKWIDSCPKCLSHKCWWAENDEAESCPVLTGSTKLPGEWGRCRSSTVCSLPHSPEKTFSQAR